MPHRQTAGTAGSPGPFDEDREALTAPPRQGIELVDEPLGESDRPEFEPAGDGTEGSTSSSTDVLLLEFEPDREQTFLLDEIAVSLESNGQARIAVNGVVYGPYTGATDISLPFNGAVLPYGGLVRIRHQSTDSNTTTSKAMITGREV